MQSQQKPIDWILFQSIILVFGLVVDVLNYSVFLAPILGFFSFAIYIGLNWKGFTEINFWGGIPNLVTTIRLLLLFLAPFLKDNFSLAVLATIVISLDGIDGLLARKLNQVTHFGGRLDMETDAFFCLLFSLLIYVQHPDLYWVLLAGSLRYLFEIVTTFFKNNNAIASGKKYARFFAGCYFISFICFYFFEGNLGKYFLLAGNLLVIFSFGISFVKYYWKKNIE